MSDVVCEEVRDMEHLSSKADDDVVAATDYWIPDGDGIVDADVWVCLRTIVVTGWGNGDQFSDLRVGVVVTLFVHGRPPKQICEERQQMLFASKSMCWEGGWLYIRKATNLILSRFGIEHG
jgi:hypothetical protein